MNERTQPPTQRKLRHAKEKGERPFSPLFLSSLFFIFALLWGRFFIGNLFLKWGELSHWLWKFPALNPLDGLFEAGKSLFLPLSLLLGGWVLLAILFSIFSKRKKEKKRFSLPSFSSLKGAGRSALLFFLIFLVLVSMSWIVLESLWHQEKMLSKPLLDQLINRGFLLCLMLGIGLLLLGIFDYFFQWRRFLKEQKMTKEEVRREKQETEANSLIRAEIRNRTKQK